MAKTKTKKTTAPKGNKHKLKLTETLKKLRDLKKMLASKIKEAKSTAHVTGYQKGVADALKASEKINKTLSGKLQKHKKSKPASKGSKATHAPRRKKAKTTRASSASMGHTSTKRRGRPKKLAL